MLESLSRALRKQGIAKSKYNALVNAINHPLAEGFTEECRTMLITSLPLSICVPVDERHEIQQEVVEMLGTLITGVAGKLHEEVERETKASTEVEQLTQSLANDAEKA